MSRKEELRNNRLSKLKKIQDAGVSPYPINTERTHFIIEAQEKFDDLKEEKEIVLAGRIKSFRQHGKIAFLNIEDGKGELQIFVSSEIVGAKSYNFLLDNFDIGDFIEAKGTLFLTKKGEKTLKVDDYKVLAKSLFPLPEKWHGLQNAEERYRKRYLDLIFNSEVKDKFEKRFKIIKEIRRFLEDNDFMEVETPVLHPIYGGTAAKPFKTHYKALDSEFYLRIAPELYLKRLIIGGWEKIYEFARCFRNEGIDRSHNPEFTLLEFYWAYADYKDLMKFTEKMFCEVLLSVFGRTDIWYQGEKIDFSTPWPRKEFYQLFQEETGIDLEKADLEELKKEAGKMGIEIDRGADKANISDEIFKHKSRHKLRQPTFLIHHPKGFQPLAKPLPGNGDKLANFQLYVGGWEIINAFSELNDPVEQLRVFKKQEEMFKEGFEEAQRMDSDFIEALEHGMPPTAGFGMGIDRLCALLTDFYSLRETILFPAMKKEKK